MFKLSIDIMLELMRKSYKSSNKKIIIALRTIIAFIKRAIEEFKLQTILDEICKLIFDSNQRDSYMNKNIIYIKHQAASKNVVSLNISYISVLDRLAEIILSLIISK